MDGKMKVAVMEGIGKIGFVERDIPTPAADEVLVKLDYVGICGSDMHYYETGAIGNYVVEPPFVLGHEPGGVVVEVGSWIYDTVVEWFATRAFNKSAEDAVNNCNSNKQNHIMPNHTPPGRE